MKGEFKEEKEVSDNKVKTYLKSIGKSVFVKCFYEFKDHTFVEKCNLNIKSSEMRQRFANYIFANGLEYDALNICINSRINKNYIKLAKKIFEDNRIENQMVESKNQIIENIDKLPNDFIIDVFSNVIKVMKDREMVRGHNITGDYAEYLVKKYFENLLQIELHLETQSTKGFDLKVNDERYQIKGITGNETSNFSNTDNNRPFDYVIIVKFDNNFKVENMYKLNWEQFNLCRKTYKNKVVLIIDKELKDNSVDLMVNN